MNRPKLTHIFLSSLLVLNVALVSCISEGDDDDDSRIPVVYQLA